MDRIQRMAEAVRRPFADREAAALEAYEDAVTERHARGMGLTASREERLAALLRATDDAPVLRLTRRRR